MRSLLLALVLAAPAVAAAQDCVVPDLLVVFDTSGSMSEPAGDGRTKWDAAVDAVGTLAARHDRTLRWGLELFPGDQLCAEGFIAVPVPSTGAAVGQALRATGPGGGTPIARSLAVAREHLASLGDGRPHHVLLVTDGQPNCNGALDWTSCACTCNPQDPRCTCEGWPENCLDDQATIREVHALAQDGVSTFVVGFGGGVNPAVLDALAVAGGTARNGAGARYYDASDGRSLVAALDAIAARLVTRPCAGPCGEGVETCTEEGWSACDAPQPGDVRTCGGDMEGCGVGEQTCGPGGWSACNAAQPGETRTCETACGQGVRSCLEGGVWSGCADVEVGDVRDCESGCGPGVQACEEGGWTECFGEGGVSACGGCGAPPEETCNGRDDDCDGTIDEDGAAGGGGAELGGGAGACRRSCFEDPCPDGEVCTEQLVCVPASCAACGDWPCVDGRCVDPCADVTCPAGRVCRSGACVEDSCLALGCAPGEVCDGAACVPDPCGGVLCGAGSFCRDGACVGSCASVSCGPGERCADGACGADACADVSCGAGEACSGGACATDPCEGVFCPAGRVCDRGACVVDPCLGVSCNAGEVCAYGSCYAEGAVPPPPDPATRGSSLDRPAPGGEEPGGAGGGCGCGTGGVAEAALALLALAVWLSRPRRAVRPRRGG